MKLDDSPTLTETKKTSLWMKMACGIVAAVVIAIGAFLMGRGFRSDSEAAPISQAAIPAAKAAQAKASGTVTNIYAHNLRLHQGPDFRVYIQWLRGQLKPARKGITPSFDDPESFYLDVTNGVIRANIGDMANYLNAQSKDAPLRDIKMTGVGDQVTITGTMHKLISIPVEVKGVVSPGSNDRIQIHVTKISLLKIPFKALLGGLHVTLADFMKSETISGLEVNGNDIFFDPERLLPPPHIKGRLTKVSMVSPDMEAVYGDVAKDVERVDQWRNFLRLRDGSLTFGKLTMHNVDLIMVDISQDAWFDLDLANYQAQLVGGYTRITPEAGLQIFMPDVSEMKQGASASTNIPWLKNRNAAPPAEVVRKN